MHLSGRKILSLILCLSILIGITPAYGAEKVSSWARADYQEAQKLGLVPEILTGVDLTKPVSRQEFCSLALLLYEAISGETVPGAKHSNFTDTSDGDINRAYELGVVSGRGSNMFMPQDKMTREEMFGLLYKVLQKAECDPAMTEKEAKGILANFRDKELLADWATISMATMIKLDLTNGANKNMLEPKLNPTREQAIILALRVAQKFEPSTVAPMPPVKPIVEADALPSRSDPVPATTKPQGDSDEVYRQKLARVYGDKLLLFGTSMPYYPSEEAAKADMVFITVPAWDLDSKGGYVSKKYRLEVQKNLASTISQIFEDIYNSSEKFPIHDVGGYAWRNGKSDHSIGVAIDINANENPQISKDGTVWVGKAWEPGINPYSIAEDSQVVRIFAQHGFAWGGNAWVSSKDYMHFSYFGK